MIDEEKLKELIKRRDDFLEDHYELQKFQEKIDATLDEIGDDPIARCRILNAIMMHHYYQLNDKFQELVDTVRDSKVVESIDTLARSLLELRKELEDDSQGRR